MQDPQLEIPESFLIYDQGDSRSLRLQGTLCSLLGGWWKNVHRSQRGARLNFQNMIFFNFVLKHQLFQTGWKCLVKVKLFIWILNLRIDWKTKYGFVIYFGTNVTKWKLFLERPYVSNDGTVSTASLINMWSLTATSFMWMIQKHWFWILPVSKFMWFSMRI